MTRILLVSPEKNTILENSIMLQWTATAGNALRLLAGQEFDLVIIHEQLPDMTGRKLVENIIAFNAMLNCVVMSGLSKEEFHEAYEGLGVLMQFPLTPGKEDILKLQEHLDRIRRISDRVKSLKRSGE